MKNFLSAAIIIFFAVSTTSYAQLVQSTFTSGDEGWTNEGDFVYTPPQYFSTGGNPGGYIRNLDENIGDVYYWVAPAKFLGNHASKYNRTLRYDLFQNTTSSQFEEADVLLEGNGIKLRFSTSYNPAITWTTYVITLNESSGWVIDTAGYPLPTKAQMQSALSNITKFRIRAEYNTTADQDGLDNVIFGGTTNYAGPGNMAAFNGTGAYINLGNSSLLKPTAQITVQCWAFIKDFNDTYRLVSNTQTGGYSILIENNKIAFSVRINGDYRVVTADLPSANTWHHYALTYDGRILSGYIDGVLQQSFDVGGNFPIAYNNSNSTLVGAEAGTGSSADGSYGYLPGYIEELSFWDTALTQKQIKDWMCRKTTTTHPLYANLKAYYRFDQQKSDTRVTDQKNAVYGTMINGCAFAISSAPVGDTSSYIYGGNTLALKHPDGDSLGIQVTKGNPSGIHVYRVDAAPSITRGATGIGPNNRYFGVFHFGDTTTVYRAVYNYKGNPFVTTSAESSLRLYKRNNNADTIWRNASATLNTVSKTLTANGQKTEYIIGATDTALQQKSNVSIGDITIAEGNSASKIARFTVQLNTAMSGTATLAFTTKDSTATATDNDYQQTSGIVTFEPGTVIDTIRIRVYGDIKVEPAELFKVILNNPVNINIPDTVATGRITNDDGAAVSVSSSINTQSATIIPNLVSRKQVWVIQGISGMQTNIIITDANGRKVFNVKNYQNNQSFYTLLPGIYFYQVQTQNAAGKLQQYTGKMILTD